MSLNQSVAEAGHSNSGSAAAPVADSGAMEKLDLTLEEIIGAGDRKEAGQSNSRIGATTRYGRRPISGRHETRNGPVRRPGRAETLVNLKFAGSINKRRNPMNSSTHGAISQHYQRTAQPRSMLAVKAFQQLPAIAAAAQQSAATQYQQPQQQYQHHHHQPPYAPMVGGYTTMGVAAGQIPHLLVPAVAAPAASGAYVWPQPGGNSKYGNNQGSRLNAQDAALLSTEVIQEENGDTIVRFKQTDLVIVKAGTGDMILTSGGYRTFSTKAILNQALQPVGLWVDESTVSSSNDQASDQRGSVSHDGNHSQKPLSPEWVVSDRRLYLATFVDGMTIRQAGALTKAQMVARGSVIAQYLRQRKYDAEQKAARLNNGKGGRRRYISGTENGEKEGHDNGTGATAGVVKSETTPPVTPAVYQHQALESVNEDLDQMAE